METTKLTAAFKILRAQGFIARQSFSCCSSCAGYEIATDVGKMPESRRAKIKGCVFYTRQDARDVDAQMRRRWNKDRPVLYIAYGPISVHEQGDFGLPAAECGKLVTEALRAEGLGIEWDGNPNTKIRVTL
jgi:hypothetical protein